MWVALEDISWMSRSATLCLCFLHSASKSICYWPHLGQHWEKKILAHLAVIIFTNITEQIYKGWAMHSVNGTWLQDATDVEAPLIRLISHQPKTYMNSNTEKFFVQIGYTQVRAAEIHLNIILIRTQNNILGHTVNLNSAKCTVVTLTAMKLFF